MKATANEGLENPGVIEPEFDVGLFLHPALRMARLTNEALQLRVPGYEVTVSDPTGVVPNLLAAMANGVPSDCAVADVLHCRSEGDALQVRAALSRLVRAGYLIRDKVEYCRDRLADQIAFLSSRQPAFVKSPARSLELPVCILGTGILADAISIALAESGLSVVHDTRHDAVLSIACDDGDDRKALDALGAGLIAAGAPVLFCTVDCSLLRLGPLVLPGQTGCHCCLHLRGRANSRFPEEYQAHGFDDPRPSASAVRVLAGLVVAEVLKFRGGLEDQCLLGEILEMHLLTLAIDRAQVVRVARCPICGGDERDIPPAALWDPRGL
jgi:bacteriocin biosynthesis cyclodehydratase domain-containing protein